MIEQVNNQKLTLNHSKTVRHIIDGESVLQMGARNGATGYKY